MTFFKLSSPIYRPQLSTILTIVLLFWSLHSVHAGETCSELFFKDTSKILAVKREFGTFRKDFVLDQHYKVEVSNQSDIKNQCNLGTCHLHSWVSLLEHDYKSANHEEMKISTHYLSIKHWIRKSLELLDSTNEVEVQLGANVFGSRRSILNSGIIPDEVWTGSRDFQSAQLSSRITEYIKNITARAKWEISKQKDASQSAKIREKAKADILNIFENLVGPIPSTFIYKGREFTPMSFQKEYFSELNKPITQIRASVERKSPTVLEQSGASYTILTANIDTIESAIRNLLDHEQNVYVSYDHNAEFVDSKSGVMSIGAFLLPPGAGPVSRQQRAFFEMSSGGHAVQIVGYDYDPKTNRVIKWKLKNSWGENSGDHGYYHMYNDYLRAFITSITFYSDPHFTPRIDERNPTQLELEF